MTATHEQLLDAIGAALGESGREVLGGAIGPNGCVGWIEQRTEPPRGDFVPVEIDVRVVVDGQLHVSPLATYNPYFGCRVYVAAWIAGGFVFAYAEKGHKILARFAAPYLQQQLVVLHGPCLIVDDRIVDLDTWQGVLHVRSLVDLEPGIPVLTELAWRDTVPLAQELRLDEHGNVVQVILPDRCHVIPLPPNLRLPSSDKLRKRWTALLAGRPKAGTVVNSLGAAWLAPQPIKTEYGFHGPKRSAPGTGLPWFARVGLPKAAPILGWPSEGSFEERLDRMFLAMVGRAATR